MKALVTGASGLLGKHLVPRLERPRLLVRDPARLAGADALAWSADRPVPEGALDGVDAVVHLAGSPVFGRMTEAKKRDIRDSRVLGTRRVVEALVAARARATGSGGGPSVLVCASAVGYYGSRGDETLTEESSRGSGFLAEVCDAWEAEARGAERAGVRVVSLRTGIVLARDGGALATMRPAFLAGVGGPLGSGDQWMPWIHIDDVVGLVLHAATVASVRGPLNVSAPAPETNTAFSKTLAHALHRPALVRTPAFALRLVLGEGADIVTGSQRAVPAKALATGYAFRFAALEDALRDLFPPSP